ncbi:HK97-gp10 family putative phage morphogenesis protein [Ornithinimicrobium sp. LYQ92]|uniref:HK97-gp10 family putative phage morphogenesis protein n=1 Tax=Serinicoccus sp. LYQ92 TaxID=3378798 RepID=UPI0038529474
MDKVTFDTTELDAWADHLVKHNSIVRNETTAILRRAGRAAVRDSKKWVNTSGRYTKHYRRAITMTEMPGGLAVEYGPEIGYKQSFLGKILELGTVNNPPHPHMIPAGETQAPIIEGAVARAVLRALKG